MLALSTKSKVHIAKLICRTLLDVRTLFGLSPTAQVRRKEILWQLDLREGIDLAIYFGIYEKESCRAWSRLATEGMVALDIGANIGFHSLLLADRVGASGKVFAFEPADFAFEKLQANLALNPRLSSRIEARQMALLDDSAAPVPEAVFASWFLGDITPNVHPLHQGRPSSTKLATASSLDDFVEQAGVTTVDLIKLDVDGYECSVLRGATRTLTEKRPLIVMEMAPYVLGDFGGSLSNLLGILDQTGYQLFTLDATLPLPTDESQLVQMIPAGGGINVLARPAVRSPGVNATRGER